MQPESRRPVVVERWVVRLDVETDDAVVYCAHTLDAPSRRSECVHLRSSDECSKDDHYPAHTRTCHLCR